MLLGQNADMRPHLLRLLDHIEPGDTGPARCRRKNRGHHADTGGLARTVRPQQCQDGPGVYVQADPVYCTKIIEVFAEFFNFDHKSSDLLADINSLRADKIESPPSFLGEMGMFLNYRTIIACPGSVSA